MLPLLYCLYLYLYLCRCLSLYLSIYLSIYPYRKIIFMGGGLCWSQELLVGVVLELSHLQGQHHMNDRCVICDKGYNVTYILCTHGHAMLVYVCICACESVYTCSASPESKLEAKPDPSSTLPPAFGGRCLTGIDRWTRGEDSILHAAVGDQITRSKMRAAETEAGAPFITFSMRPPAEFALSFWQGPSAQNPPATSVQSRVGVPPSG